MKYSRLVALIGAASAALLVSAAAQAATIGFSPSDITANVSDSISVDVVMSDLAGEIVSAYDLDLTYDDTVLTATNVDFGLLLGDPALFEVFEDFDLTTSGVVDFAQLSLLSDASLLALQGGDSFVLATISFDVIAEGSSALDFQFDAFNDIKGSNGQVLDVQVEPGSFTTDDETPIPEPSAAILFGVGAVLIAARLRR